MRLSTHFEYLSVRPSVALSIGSKVETLIVRPSVHPSVHPSVRPFSLATAKLATFDTDMLWESCSKFTLDQLSHSMSVANIASLDVAKKYMS